MDDRDYSATSDVLVASWQITPPTESAGPSDWAVLLAALEERILDLLIRKPDRLMSALYILDISEKRFAQAMDQPTMEDRAHDLAHAVLERESEKIRTRREYAEARAKAAKAARIDRSPPENKSS